ncbi:MAG: 2-oxoacid:ferredoxin oxidoreductase subunit beta [Candidatus Marinimicrobia bacterium]|nr:2-oxoacid:ferredoxin oxidoreductase subunit beta [Candidatus Neomarinimicrobiota bacterium]MCF7850322.1 2-oxoacid:ferredoxin oxidoreductase subunit beta [Candidatus Neomarinimicrobiota bacterium]MCF7903914.1 2-oxoacid:ferredoxin oxidoreductase subunit beta [Candidatus Neomarinimicrobiota bacterium]
MSETTKQVETLHLTRKDFVPDNDVRWCPGCGDYSILANMQKTLPSLEVEKEKYVFVSGIGCSSRFPYYMDTYGFHGIHGRAPAIASGVKLANPDLSVWIITGDGDGLSIGGNHLIHVLRRNIDVNIMLFNNRIYGLTKGQYSPTSMLGKKTKSSPFGSIDRPFNPSAVAAGSNATFIARALDVDARGLQESIKRSQDHKGASFIEVYQNCIIFNDGEFADVENKSTRPDNALFVVHGEPMIFGKENNKGIVVDNHHPKVVELGDKWKVKDLLVHDETNMHITNLLLEMTFDPETPTPFGILRAVDQPTYDDLLHSQIDQVTELRGEGNLKDLFNSGDVWEVK